MNGYLKRNENVINDVTDVFGSLLNEPSIEKSLKLLTDRIPTFFEESEPVSVKIGLLGKEYQNFYCTDPDVTLVNEIVINGKNEGFIEISLKGLYPEVEENSARIEEYKKQLDMLTRVVTIAVEKREEIAQLKSIKKQIQDCYNKLDDYIFVIDSKTNIVDFNTNFQNCTGLSSDELHKMNLSELMEQCAIGSKELLPIIEKAAEYGSFTFECEHLCRNEENIPMSINCKPMNDEKGLFICVGKDISERKRTEELLKRERDKLYNYLDVAGSIIGIVNTDLNVIFVNNKGAEVLGYDKKDIIGKNWFDYFLPESVREITRSNFIKVLDHELDPPDYFENVIITKEGEERLIFWHDVPLEDENGRRIGVISSGEDITESRRMEAMLVESEKNLKTIFNQVEDLIYICRPYGNFIDVNKTMISSTGYTKEQMLEMSPMDIVKPEMKQLMNSYSERIIREESVIFEITFVLSDGTLLPLEINSRLVEYEGEQAILSVARNITERKKAEERLKRYACELKQSNDLKDLFTDIIRHDLLTPASVIKGYTEELLDTISDEKARKLALKVKSNNDRLIEMLETATTLAKLQKQEDIDFEVIDLVPVFKMIIDGFREQIEASQQTVNVYGETHCPAVANPVIEEIFANLLSNAIKYSPVNSIIDVTFSEEANMWKVAVTDRGAGIPDSDKTLLFNRFQRVDKSGIKGTGLGLAIVKRIIELHGGAYGVNDNPEGKGSTFWVTLKKAF